MANPARLVKSLLFLAVAAAAPLYFLQQGSWSPGDLFSALENGARLLTLEDNLREAMPMGRQLEQAGLDIRLFAGQREQNGIFISDSALIRNIDPPRKADVRQNSQALVEFARSLLDVSNRKIQTYLAVIPTSGGILDQHLPRFADSRMVNQRRTIEDIYNQVSPSVRTVDVFSTLDSRSEQYIYYRTENNLTALGGFYTYYAIGRRLGLTNRALNRYEIEYAEHSLYGDLYQTPSASAAWRDSATAPYRSIRPDIVALYRYSSSPREYTVTHWDGTEARTYHTLYPKHVLESGYPLDVYLGGSSARIEITTSINTSSQKKSRLLVFGDKTAAAYLPFLVNHYQEVTLVNLFLMDRAELEALRPDLYDEVLFAYSIETYIHTNNHIARITGIDWDALFQ